MSACNVVCCKPCDTRGWNNFSETAKVCCSNSSARLVPNFKSLVCVNQQWCQRLLKSRIALCSYELEIVVVIISSAGLLSVFLNKLVTHSSLNYFPVNFLLWLHSQCPLINELYSHKFRFMIHCMNGAVQFVIHQNSKIYLENLKLKEQMLKTHFLPCISSRGISWNANTHINIYAYIASTIVKKQIYLKEKITMKHCTRKFGCNSPNKNNASLKKGKLFEKWENFTLGSTIYNLLHRCNCPNLNTCDRIIQINSVVVCLFIYIFYVAIHIKYCFETKKKPSKIINIYDHIHFNLITFSKQCNHVQHVSFSERLSKEVESIYFTKITFPARVAMVILDSWLLVINFTVSPHSEHIFSFSWEENSHF